MNISPEYIPTSGEIDEQAPEFLNQVWARRAQQLSQPLELETSGEQLNLIQAILEGEAYGFDTRYIFEIRALERITPVPRVPAWVAGVVNLRGRILSVLNLPRFLGLPTPEKTPEPGYLIVVETSTMELALLAEEVRTVETLPSGKIQPATDAIHHIRSEYLLGLVTDPDVAPLVILNLPALLADPQLILYEELN